MIRVSLDRDENPGNHSTGYVPYVIMESQKVPKDACYETSAPLANIAPTYYDKPTGLISLESNSTVHGVAYIYSLGLLLLIGKIIKHFSKHPDTWLKNIRLSVSCSGLHTS